ncbi:MAG: hypothetical protein ACE14T_02960, partial [Syntrophales bacterium]
LLLPLNDFRVTVKNDPRKKINPRSESRYPAREFYAILIGLFWSALFKNIRNCIELTANGKKEMR